MFDRNGDEYFAIIPASVGKGYREARAAALEVILEAIDDGFGPGEVYV